MSEPTVRGVPAAAAAAEPANNGAGLPRAFGNFALLKQIVRGERGEVFAALRPVEVERFCALKLVSEATSTRPDFVSSLRNEATRVVRRIHGNLVQIYDIGLYERRLFFVSELVEGSDLATLATRLRARKQPFPVDVAVYVAMEVAGALSYLRRLAARAGGPAAEAPPRLPLRSVLLSVDGEVKVLHYGATMSAVPTSDTLTAPPAAPGRPAGATGDSYVVGGLLRRLLTDGPPPPLALARLIDRALASEPAARPTDGDEMRAALGSILRGLKGTGAAAPPPIADLLRATLGEGGLVDRAALAAIAKSYDPRRGGAPPSWKVITLTRLESGGAPARVAPPPSPSVDPAAGEVIPGTRYRVISKIGEGGMGTVYAAEHVDLEKKVALKVLRADVAPDPETLQQFRQEARAASKVGSAYICDVTDFGELGDGRVFFVMEYLDGPSLGRALRQETHIQTGRAIPILRQVAKALGAAHEKGIVHLDVKPDNVMLLTDGTRTDAVKVVDFGIAGLMHQSGEEEEIAGTPEYIAPERAAGHGYDSRSDVYALGVMAYEMLSGVVPFHGKSHIATLTMQVKDPPEPLRRHAGGKSVAPELETLVMRMLEKDPAARPQNMAEVEALLCEAQIATGVRTPWDNLELPAVDEAWRAKLERRMPSVAGPRRRMMMGAGAVAAVSIAVAVYVGFVRKPSVVLKEVRVELTNTEEAPAVAAALLRADQAARRERYVRPPADSALYYIQSAEEEAKKLGRRSAGAAALRRAYATALTVIGNELVKADLRDLALTKYKEALLFLPDDPDLQAKAELPPEERKRHDRPIATAPPPIDEARDAATKVYLAATRGRLSEARLALKTLAAADSGGAQAARLADALRARAAAAWTGGRTDDARRIYAIVAELDPGDAEARERARAPVAAAAPPATAPAAPTVAAVAAPPGPPAAAGPAPVAAKVRPRVDSARDVDPGAPRDAAASQRAAEAGLAAMARGRLAEAEEAFTRAVRADSTNAVAVGGLADVAFERARYSDALDYARRASHLAPRNTKYLILIGDAYFKLLRYDEAVASYEKARALAPRDEAVKSRLERVEAKINRR
jgi:serine/threonine protein kinase/tetratricopeptide (TPR) repeat protein